jgi:phosphocarrier protein
VIEREAEIVNQLGLHARAAAKMVHTASAFQSRVTISRNGEEVDAKSILGIMMMAVAHGSKVTLRCDGNDEEAAMKAVTDLIANRFGEES